MKSLLPGNMSIKLRFHLILVPILVCTYVVLLGAYEYLSYQRALERLQQRLVAVSSSQSLLLAEPIANQKSHEINLMMAALIADPNLVGVAVRDAAGNLLDSYGSTTLTEGPFYQRRPINYANEDSFRRVGSLEVWMSNKEILSQTYDRINYEILLVILLLAFAFLGTNIALQRAVIRPIDLMLIAVRSAYGGKPRAQLQWQAQDEVGELFRSYNSMQRRLESYEKELHGLYSNVENRVSQQTRAVSDTRKLTDEFDTIKSQYLSFINDEAVAFLTFWQEAVAAGTVQQSPDSLQMSPAEHFSRCHFARVDAVHNLELTNLQKKIASDCVDMNKLQARVVQTVGTLYSGFRVYAKDCEQVSVAGDALILESAFYSLFMCVIDRSGEEECILSHEVVGKKVCFYLDYFDQDSESGLADNLLYDMNELLENHHNILDEYVNMSVLSALLEGLGGKLEMFVVKQQEKRLRMTLRLA